LIDSYKGAFGSQADRRAACPQCKKDTRVSTLFERIDRWDDGLYINGVIEHYAFQCNGCEAVFLARSTSNSEDYIEAVDPHTGEPVTEYVDSKSFLPAVPNTPTPSWAGFRLALHDETLHHLLSSVYKAMNNEMPVLAAIGMRTSFDRISELLEVDSELSFAKKLDALRKQGHISEVQKEFLEMLVDAGSAAAHRGWKPEPQHLETMLEVLEALIRDHFILKNEIAKFKGLIPKKK